MVALIYEEAAKKYKPEKIKILFIAESPPYCESRKERYFYFETYVGKDYLFNEIMKVLFPEEYEHYLNDKNDKTKLLTLFKEKHYFLIDACDYPINKMKRLIRNNAIKENSCNLCEKIESLVSEDTEIILITKYVYVILCDELKRRKFNVLNKEFMDFPCCGNQKKFREKLKKLL